MSEIEDIASVHLGKAGDGTVVKPYVTPDEVDPGLLVSIPRYLNRTAYGIEEDNLPFAGWDVWNAYEFSTLLKNGYPISGLVKFAYQSDSPNIVESKSVKLYLNSYNMASVIDNWEDVYMLEDKISADLEKAVGAPVNVNIFQGDLDTIRPVAGDFTLLESYCNIPNMEFNNSEESSEILEVVPSIGRYERWRSHSLRSNCRVTNQPDWGDVYVHIKGDLSVTPESLLKYIISMRKENHFHEEICECIYTRLNALLAPDELLVTCLYTRRGGIDINPVRSSNPFLMYRYTPIIDVTQPSTKTARQ